MKKLLVELLISVLGPHREENVAADEFMHHLALSRESLEYDIFSITQLDHHVLCLPVYVPCLKKYKFLILKLWSMTD